ncbi:MAG: TIGR02300 family protein [Alphaproteobacteria bacterium]
MSKKDLGKKRVCPSTGKIFYDLNKDPIVSPYTGEVLNEAVLKDPKKDKIELIEKNEISPNDEAEDKDDNTEENSDTVIPEIDEESIPDLENSSDDEIVENDADDDLTEFDDEGIDELNEDDDDDDDDFLEDDVSDVIASVPIEDDN